MATRKKPINKNYLILLGVGAAALGTWLIAGDSIKKLFKRGGEAPALEPEIKFIPSPAGTAQPKTETKETDTTGDIYDIREKLKPGSKGSGVGRLQLIINEIANIRGDQGFTANSGQKIKFPISQDRDFGPATNLGALYAFPSYKENGFITVKIDQVKVFQQKVKSRKVNTKMTAGLDFGSCITMMELHQN
jgi:hypothetical protein